MGHEQADDQVNTIKKRTAPFTIILNSVLQDNTITANARFLLCLLSSYPNDWRFRTMHLRAVTGWGRDKFRAAKKTLCDVGLLSIEPFQMADGRMHGQHWCLSAVHDRGPEKPSDGFSAPLKNRQTVFQSPYKDLKDKDLFSHKEEIESVDFQFDLFWKVAIRKERRADAKQAWIKAVDGFMLPNNMPAPMTIAAGVILQQWKDYNETCEREGLAVKFISVPVNWLNGTRWEDEGSDEPEFGTPEWKARYMPPKDPA